LPLLFPVPPWFPSPELFPLLFPEPLLFSPLALPLSSPLPAVPACDDLSVLLLAVGCPDSVVAPNAGTVATDGAMEVMDGTDTCPETAMPVLRLTEAV
jgi:hypothetical protein